VPKPKYPIPNNNFSRFIKEYLSGHSDSQNDLARKLNEIIPKNVAIPIDTSDIKSGNSTIFSWKNGTRPKEPVIREALCKKLHITYIETLFLSPSKATEYTLQVYEYLEKFIKTLSDGKKLKDQSLNMYNIGLFVNNISSSSKQYLNFSYMISQIIKAEADKIEFVHLKKYGNFDISYKENPHSFWQFSQRNIYYTNENNGSCYPADFMLSKLSQSFSQLKGDIQGILKGKSKINDDFNYNYYRISMINDVENENLMCFCTAINLIILWLKEIDSNYLQRLANKRITKDMTTYRLAPEYLLEGNDLFQNNK
jgi:hypothetical protein